MGQYDQVEQTTRWTPLRGLAKVGKSHVTPPGYLDEAENVVFTRGSGRRRPHRRKLNHTAVGCSGFKLFRDAVIPYAPANRIDSSAPNSGFTWEFWHQSDYELPATGDVRVPHLFLSPESAFTAGYGAGPGYAKVSNADSPFVLNVARLGGTYVWELYAYSWTGVAYRLTVPYKARARQHVAVVWTGATGVVLRVKYDGVTTEQTATAAFGVTERLNLTKQPWCMRGPADLAATPETPPHFKVECLRLWAGARSLSEIQANRDKALTSYTSGLIGQWTGDNGSYDHLVNEIGQPMPILFTASFPSKNLGGIEIANRDRLVPARYAFHYNRRSAAAADYVQDVYTDALAHNYVTLGNGAGNVFDTAAAGGNNYAVQIAFRFLGNDEHVGAAGLRAHHGIMTGQFGIMYDPVNAILKCYDADSPALIAASAPATTLWPGERYVVTVKRLGVNLYLFLNGVQVGTVAGLSALAGSLKFNYYGYDDLAATLSSVGNIVIEEIAWFYGQPNDKTGTFDIPVLYPHMHYTDDVGKGKFGQYITDIGVMSAALGSPTVNNTLQPGLTVRIGDFLVDLSLRGSRRRIYRVTNVVGTTITLDQNYSYESGSVRFAVTRCLYHCNFAEQTWDTESNNTSNETNPVGPRYGRMAYLPNVIDDRMKVLRPLWLANGVNADGAVANNLRSSSHLERLQRFAGKVRRDFYPCSGLARYTKEDDVEAAVGVWGTSLYWLCDRWGRKIHEGRNPGTTALIGLEGDFLYPASGNLFTAFATGTGSNFFACFDIEPWTIQGKRILLNWGDTDATSRIRLSIEDGFPTMKVYYNAGTVATMTSATRLVRKNELIRLSFYCDFDSAANSYIAIDGDQINNPAPGAWPGGGSAINTPAAGSQSLLGLSQTVRNPDAEAAGYKSFIGRCYQILLSPQEEFTTDNGMESPGAFSGYSANAECVLLLDEGSGWKLTNAQPAGATSGFAINGARHAVPILEDLPYADENHPYCLDLFRATIYGTNGNGRQFYARWTGDFDNGGNGWDGGLSGIKAPRALPRVVESGTASTEGLTAGVYQVAYCYLQSSTGLRSNPSKIITLTMGGANKIRIQDIAASEDPRVDQVEIYITPPDQSFTGLATTIPNGTHAIDLDVDPVDVRIARELSLHYGVPPKARLIKHVLGRAYWGGIGENAGALAFSEFAQQEAWYAPNIMQVDSGNWSPITGISGQRGAVHAYTRDSIYRVIPGGGDVSTFGKALAVNGTGCVSHFSIVEVGGVEVFESRDGIMAFDGNQVVPFGARVMAESIGLPTQMRGLDPYFRRAYGVWDQREQMGLWFYRRIEDGSGITGRAFCMSRAPQMDPSWSTMNFYDVSSAAMVVNAVSGLPQTILADSMGYAWFLESPTSESGPALDLDGMGATKEDGSARTLVGTWGVTQLAAHLAGDGARGFVILTYSMDAGGNISSYGLNRLLQTPAAAAFAAGDLELTAGAWGFWVLGGYRMALRSGWAPTFGYEMPKQALWLDVANTPQAAESLDLAYYGTDQKRNVMPSEFSGGSVQTKRQRMALDAGTVENAMPEDKTWRAMRWELAHFGTKPVELHEVVLRWQPEGGAHGPGMSV